MASSLNGFLESFVALGGVAENIRQGTGDLGRGVFPVDPSRSCRILTPEKLLVDASNLAINQGEIFVRDKTSYSDEEIFFIERYYNDCSWGSGGNADSASFLRLIISMPEALKNKLLDYAFIDKSFLGFRGNDDNQLLGRFIDERTLVFCGRRVLAPVWEFVNHSSFAPPFRVTPMGVETPPLDSDCCEILFKYSGKNSPMSMWKKYGFSCKCIVSYSIPFKISMSEESFDINCSGQHSLPAGEQSNLYISGNSLLIQSLPIGCVSSALPYENFKATLCRVGLSPDVAGRLFPKIRDLNLNARKVLVAQLHELGFSAQEELPKALRHEIELIESASIG